MNTLEIFGLQFVLSFLVFGVYSKWYVAPWLNKLTFKTAMAILLIPHATRHLGLVFLVPGVVNPDMPNLFANTAAYGDLMAGLLGFAALIAVQKEWRIATALLWIFSIVGIGDLANALRQFESVPYFNAAWYIPTFWVPILLITHYLILSRLIRRK